MIIVNGLLPLTISTKCSILDVVAVLDPRLTWSEMFSLGSVTFSKILRVYYLNACLVTTVLQIITLFLLHCDTHCNQSCVVFFLIAWSKQNYLCGFVCLIDCIFKTV